MLYRVGQYTVFKDHAGDVWVKSTNKIGEYPYYVTLESTPAWLQAIVTSAIERQA